VHARAQVVNFRTDSELPIEKIQKALNAFLPKEISVRGAEEVPTRFHARYGVKWKTYEYLLLNSRVRSPLLDGRAYQFPYPLDFNAMKNAARRLVGRHDFGAFRASGSLVKTSTRHIRRLAIEKRGELVKFVVEADGFLYHMVRNIVGTLLEVGRRRLSPRDFSRIFKSRKRVLAGPTVSSRGLTLASVQYGR